MEIISKDETKRIVQCKACKSKISYKMAEIIAGFSRNFIECPVCRNIIYVSIFDKKWR